MKKVSLSEMKTMRVKDFLDSACFILTADQEDIAIVFVGMEPEMFERLKSLASVIDAARGK